MQLLAVEWKTMSFSEMAKGRTAKSNPQLCTLEEMIILAILGLDNDSETQFGLCSSGHEREPAKESTWARECLLFLFYLGANTKRKRERKFNTKKKKKKGKNFTPTLVVICQKSSFNMQFERIRMNKGNAIGFYSISHNEVLRGKY